MKYLGVLLTKQHYFLIILNKIHKVIQGRLNTPKRNEIIIIIIMSKLLNFCCFVQLNARNQQYPK
jgi:hypothetical protein